jgi:hypothetical protein
MVEFICKPAGGFNPCWMKDWLGRFLLAFRDWCMLKVLTRHWEGQRKGSSWLATKKESQPS